MILMITLLQVGSLGEVFREVFLGELVVVVSHHVLGLNQDRDLGLGQSLVLNHEKVLDPDHLEVGPGLLPGPEHLPQGVQGMETFLSQTILLRMPRVSEHRDFLRDPQVEPPGLAVSPEVEMTTITCLSDLAFREFPEGQGVILVEIPMMMMSRVPIVDQAELAELAGPLEDTMMIQ
jgi:hypothetical protein